MNLQSDDREQIADYVLGLLEEGERVRFEARLRHEPGLARAVEALEQNFSALDETVEPEPLSGTLWGKVQATIDEAGPATSAANSNLRGRSVLPRWASMAAAIVVALGVGFLGGQSMNTTPETPAPLVVAVLVGDDMAPGAIVEAFGDDSVRIIPLEALVAPNDSTLEVWTLPDPETGPVSLGTFQEAREIVLGGPDLPVPQPDQLYEITLEPAGGSPTGRPTGPILLKGLARAPVT